MNGLNIADGNWELGHFDNPGTPLHLLTGFLLWIIHLFSGQGEITDDVLMRPEFYIKKCVIALFLLKALSLYYIGYKITKVTKNIFIGSGFQLIPLFILSRLSCPGLIHPDILLDSLCLLFIAFLFPVLYRTDKPGNFKESVKYVAPLALITGAITATKISTIGLVFVPLLIFSGWRSKALFLITSIGFFYFFTLPVNSKLGDFFDFIMGIATHTGHYGSGEAGIIPLAEFSNNVYHLFSRELTLLVTYIISLIGGVYFSITRKNKWGFLLLGIALAYTVQTIIIGKHYSYHYTLPMHYLFIITLFALAKLLENKCMLNRAKNNKWIVSLGLFLFIIAGIIRAFNYNIYAPYDSAKMIPTDSFLKNRHQPTLIFPGKDYLFLTSSYVQPALWFGKYYSGYTTRWDRANELDAIYPSCYIHNAAPDKVEDWNKDLPFWLICKRHNLLDIYVRDKSDYNIENYISNLSEKHSWPKTVFQLNRIYENTESREEIYQLSIDTGWFSANYITSYRDEIKFGEERNQELYVPKRAEPVKLTKIEVRPGDFITASVWRKSGNKKCFIELRGPDGFYDHTGFVTDRKNEWEKITITHEVPQGYNEGSLDITVRNATRADAFFDDFVVTVIRQKGNIKD